MPSKKKGGRTEGQDMESTDFEDLIEDFNEEEGKVVELMDGFAKLLDDVYKEGLSFYDVALVQRVVNAFLLDFMEEMYDGEMDELIDEIMDLSEEKASKETEKPVKPKKPKKTVRPKAKK